MDQRLTCWIVGETTLAIRCADILLRRDFQLLGIASGYPEVGRWARERGVKLVPRFGGLAAAIAARPGDYLFSIVNSHILGTDILAGVSRGAINYHDSLLPRYAGMHSTSWAIINGEAAHGVTWHVVTGEVDAGAILEQRAVPIAPDDTALSLNARCYEAAVAAFETLADGLAEGLVVPREQDLTARTWFGRCDRPRAAGLIDWRKSAAEISALVRGLDFGSAYANPLGRAKLLCGAEPLACAAVSVSGTPSSGAPGTVMGVEDAGITVATGDRDVLITRLETLDGVPQDLPAVVARHQLAPGALLSFPSAGEAERIGSVDHESCRHEAYWVRVLRDLPPLQLPFRRAADAGGASEARRIALAIPAELAAHPAAALTALAAWVARVTGSTSVAVTLETVEVARAVRGLEHLFAAQVPVRLEVDLAATFAAQADAVAHALRSAAARGSYPRDLVSRHPELRGGTSATPAIGCRLAPRGSQAPPALDLVLDVMDGGREAALWYRCDAFEERDARRIAAQLDTCMRSAAGHPGLPLARLDLVPAEERQRLLVEWNDTAADFPRDATLHGLFEEQARRTPDAPALRFGETLMTYAELDRAAERWVRHLRARGVGRDAIVGLRVARSPDLVVGMLAIMKAGGAWLPLDPAWPDDRTRFVLEDAGTVIVLTQRALRDQLPEGRAAVLCLDSRPEAAEPRDAVPADAESLAYVLYTSGSTGKPKGVLVPHRAVVNYLTWCIGAYGAGDGAGAPVHSPVTFDLTITSLFAPLLAGRPAHLLDEALGAEALVEALRSGRDYSLVKLTPSHLELLRRRLAPEESSGRARAFVIGGEQLTSAALEHWRRHAPESRLINEYGPTETVVGCCTFEVPPGIELDGSVPIGKPIANTRLHVLDEQLQLLPIGVPGELFIGGEGVARGYLNRVELTAERFVADPFDPGKRLYRTGDRARWREDGVLEFLGRLDGQVKLRGYRIELGEIESVLAAHPDVQEAAATVWDLGEGDQRLAAYFVPEAGAAVDASALREWLQRALPDYMVPAAIERLDRLPLTPNGKVSRADLPRPAAAPARASDPVAPRSPLERQLAGIWEDLLGVPVGVTDSFFELGGHSLLAVRMMERVREATGAAPPLSVLLTHATVEGLATVLSQGVPADAPPMVQLATGHRRPFFYLHGDFISRAGFYAETLARQLDPDQPMYVLRPHDPGGPETIEAMAADYVGLVRAVQPAGPYLLGGLCSGGAVAYEMARQLRARGERIALLALVNTTHRNARLGWVLRATGLAARALRLDEAGERKLFLRVRDGLLATMEQLPAFPRRAGAPARIAWWTRLLARNAWRITWPRIRQMLGAGETMTPMPAAPVSGASDDLGGHPLTGGDTIARYLFVDEVMRSFAAGPFDGRVTLIWWEESAAFDAEPGLHGGDETRGWGDLAEAVQVRRIPGKHRAVPGRNVEALGRELARLIRTAL